MTVRDNNLKNGRGKHDIQMAYTPLQRAMLLNKKKKDFSCDHAIHTYIHTCIIVYTHCDGVLENFHD